MSEPVMSNVDDKRKPPGHPGLGLVRATEASALAAGAPIGLAELVTALRGEYRKLGRGLPAQVERMDGGDGQT